MAHPQPAFRGIFIPVSLNSSQALRKGGVAMSQRMLGVFVIASGVLLALGSVLPWQRYGAVPGFVGEPHSAVELLAYRVIALFLVVAIYAVVVGVRVAQERSSGRWAMACAGGFFLCLLFTVVHGTSYPALSKNLAVHSFGIGFWLSLLASTVGLAACAYLYISPRTRRPAVVPQ